MLVLEYSVKLSLIDKAYLAHETGNDTVEAGTGKAETLLSGTERAEVFACARNNVVSQFHHDATSILPTNGHVKVAFVKRHY